MIVTILDCYLLSFLAKVLKDTHTHTHTQMKKNACSSWYLIVLGYLK